MSHLTNLWTQFEKDGWYWTSVDEKFTTIFLSSLYLFFPLGWAISYVRLTIRSRIIILTSYHLSIATPFHSFQMTVFVNSQLLSGWGTSKSNPTAKIVRWSNVEVPTIGSHTSHSLMGWSHRSVLIPSVDIFGYKCVKNGGPTSISQHNPQQFHG